jgi:hypothetical protein
VCREDQGWFGEEDASDFAGTSLTTSALETGSTFLAPGSAVCGPDRHESVGSGAYCLPVPAIEEVLLGSEGLLYLDT